MTSNTTRYTNRVEIIDPFMEKTEFIKAIYLDQSRPQDYVVDFKPSDFRDLPASCYWDSPWGRTVIIEKSNEMNFDPDMPNAKGAIRFKAKKRLFRKKTDQWQPLPDYCRFVTTQSVYWDVSNPPDDTREHFDKSDRDFISDIFSGAMPANVDNLDPVEFGIKLEMSNYQETVTRTKTADLMKSLKSLHLWALAIMVVGLLMMILITASGGSTS
tara:strand:- start:220 stop:861 length:642 start_codon:yes stop_codon:yes gene_type:complete